jgi:hypothetical protein
MIDYLLKFADQAKADAVLFTEQTEVQGDVVETFKVPKYNAIDVIGVIYKPTGKMVGDMPETAPLDGWHVNVRHVVEAPELDKFVVQVNTPVRAWL